MVLVLMVSYYIILLAKSMVGRNDTNNDNDLSLDDKLLYNTVLAKRMVDQSDTNNDNKMYASYYCVIVWLIV